jgi:2-(1,2-epoxy-1,2-dihydrophenyl)acetyl-CoA isomerase
MEDLVQLRRDQGIAWLTLNRPERRNAINQPMAHAFLERCKQLAADSSIRAVVLSGNGPSFGVGGDLAEMRADPPRVASELIACMHEGVQLLTAMDAPVIASVHGAVAGGSLSLALACDLAIAADNATFNLAYVNLGTSCDLSGSWHLPRLVGLRNAMAIALLGENFGAQEAQRLGLVNQVVPQVALQDATNALAQRLAQGPTLAIGRTKRLLRASFDHTLAQQLELEGQNFRACAASGDFAEGLAAFFGKREPEFKGS